jgi:hypothetical protein
MTCGGVASTGVPVAAIVAVGAAVLCAGLALLVLARTRRGRSSTAVVVLLLISSALLLGSSTGTPARAAAPDCSGALPVTSATNSVTIVQTSTIIGMAPGVAPAPITGRVTNRGGRATRVTSVTVSIAGVSPRRGHSVGRCRAGDYVLRAVTMPVNRTLEPGESAEFRGASIGFRNKSINQDACKGAVVGLRYVSH